MLDARNAATPAGRTPTRAELVARWTAARKRRDAAQLGSEEHRRAVIEVGELEVEINALDVQATEGRPARPAQPDHSGEAGHS
jgi:hypothetical protein